MNYLLFIVGIGFLVVSYQLGQIVDQLKVANGMNYKLNESRFAEVLKDKGEE